MVFTVFMCVDETGFIDSYGSCEKLLVIDVDYKRLVNTIHGLGEGVEYLIEKYDPVLMMVADIDEESRLDIEEWGVKVVVTGRKKYSSLLEDFYGFKV